MMKAKPRFRSVHPSADTRPHQRRDRLHGDTLTKSEGPMYSCRISERTWKGKLSGLFSRASRICCCIISCLNAMPLPSTFSRFLKNQHTKPKIAAQARPPSARSVLKWSFCIVQLAKLSTAQSCQAYVLIRANSTSTLIVEKMLVIDPSVYLERVKARCPVCHASVWRHGSLA
jgi:hypothetical protein